MKITDCFAVAAAALLSLAVAETASARSLLYYYDFDTVDGSGNIVVAGVNKGTGNLEPVVVNASGAVASDTVAKYAGGAFSDSGYSLSANKQRAIWLPQSRSGVGCSTTNGFTISLWVKPPSDDMTGTFADILGFSLGDKYAQLEYSGDANKLRMYGISADNELSLIFTRNEWTHVGIVVTPDAMTNSTITLYHNGAVASHGRATCAGVGTLKQVYIGAVVRQIQSGVDVVRYQRASPTAIDEFALFNYPATAEQIKWLAKHKPGQPTGGPGREMPLCWRFERDYYGIAETWNSGTGDIPVQSVKSESTDVPYTMKGALNTVSAYQAYGNLFTFAAIDDEAGLGASAGSGFSFSFWLYAAETPSKWADFFGFYLGSRNAIHLEWTDRGSPSTFCAYGGVTPAGEVTEGRLATNWQHVAISYDAANSAVDVYLDGVKRAVTYLQTPISQTDVVKRITAGPGSYYFENNTLVRRGTAHTINTSVDELAFFNYSISPEEIAWLGSNIPKLPPLTATNLARTVSADCAWAGGLASWSVLDGTGADTGRFSIYPSVEDTETEVAVSIASAATIVNDTFVTPAKLKFTNGTGGASASATLSSAANTMFAPENLEVGDGVTLTVKPGDVTIADTLTFGEGAKIVFGKPGAGEEKIVKGLSFGSYSLPSGDSDLLSHFGARGSYTVSLSEDGKTVNLNLTNGLVIFVR